MEQERLQILKMIENGQIDAQEAATLLVALETPEEEVPAEVLPPQPAPSEHPGESWARFWIFPAMAGAAILFLGVVIMGLVSITSAAAGWLLCGWPLLLLGLAVVLLAFWSRSATWMHLRISEEGRRKIAMSFPLPLTLAAWVLRVAQPFVPQLADTGVDDVIIALRDSARHGEPLFIDVEDNEAGERVELYIG
jgi:hypothetical protein